MNIVVTNTSSPTFIGTLHSLREAFSCKLIGISKNPTFDSYVVDKHYNFDQDSDEYLAFVLDICKKEQAMCIIPHCNEDRILFMKNKDLFEEIHVKIISSSVTSIVATESKVSFMEVCKELEIPVPEYYVASTYEELKVFAKKLGYPFNKVVVKPVSSSGSKGFRILNKKVNYRKVFSKVRSDHPDITLSGLRAIIGDKFEPLIVSDFLSGDEYTLDCLRINNLEKYIVRKRIETKNGLTVVGQIVENDLLISYAKKLAEYYDLTTIFGFQFMQDQQGNFKILECNPRIQGTTIMSALAGANIIAACIANMCNLEPIPLSLEKNMIYYRMYGGLGIGKKIKKVIYTRDG